METQIDQTNPTGGPSVQPKDEDRIDRVDLGKELNHLLNRKTRLGAVDEDCGLQLPHPGKRSSGPMNIVVITGRPGSGKSTLALQLAVKSAIQGFDSIYLSLEDHPKSIQEKAKAFGWNPCIYLPQIPPDLEEDDSAKSLSSIGKIVVKARETTRKDPGWQNLLATRKTTNETHPSGAIIAASLLPRPVSATEERSKKFFLEQYRYLEKLVKSSAKHAQASFKERTGVRIIVIDSLSMLRYSGQTRESLFRVFDLFRANGIMAIFTVDGGSTSSPDDFAGVPFDSTMADVVFSFSSKVDSAYLVHYISVEKSRYTKTCYGLHPFKIEDNNGIRVFPSLHAIISATQAQTISHADDNRPFPFGWGDDLTRYVVRSNLRRPGVVALHGPHGTRKSIIAANFLIHGLVGDMLLSTDDFVDLRAFIAVLKNPDETISKKIWNSLPAAIRFRLDKYCETTVQEDGKPAKESEAMEAKLKSDFVNELNRILLNSDFSQLDITYGSKESPIEINRCIVDVTYQSSIRAYQPPGQSGILIRLKDAGECSNFDLLPTYPEICHELQRKLKRCNTGSKGNTSQTRNLLQDIESYEAVNKTKIGISLFGISGQADNGVIVVVDFNTGMVLPEEFVDIIQCIYEKVKVHTIRREVRRVVLDDISVIGGVSYPLLERSQTTADLFLSGFVHVMRNKMVNLMLVGTMGNLESGNKIVDKAIALADAVVETRIRDIFGDRYILLAGDGAMSYEAAYQEYVPPALQVIPGEPPQMKFDRELLRGLTGFDGPAIFRTKVYAYLFALNELHRRYNSTLPYLVEPFCGLPIDEEKRGKDDVSEQSGLRIIHFDPDISEIIHRSLGVPITAGLDRKGISHPPKEHTVLATIDEFQPALSGERSKDYTRNVLIIAWRVSAVSSSADITAVKPFPSWRELSKFITKIGPARDNIQTGGEGKPVFGKVWIDRSVKETLSCCLLDCLISGWRQGAETGLVITEDNLNAELNRLLKMIEDARRKTTSTPKQVESVTSEVSAIHNIFKIAREAFPEKWREHSCLWPERTGDAHLPDDASVYICWYSQLRELLSRPKYIDRADDFQVAALPGGGFKGDWKLLVLPGSVSHGLGNAVVDALTTQDEDYRRFVLGIGLPAAEQWRNGTMFRAWPGAKESETLDKLFEIHKQAYLRSKIDRYPKFTRSLSTFIQRLAGDWDKKEPDFLGHLGRLCSHIKFLKNS